MSVSAPTSRPVHPCVFSLTEGNRCVEHAVWAYVTPSSRQKRHCNHALPNLITASASTVTVYSVDQTSGRLYVEQRYPFLNGTVLFLSSVTSCVKGVPDALVLGFAGHAQMSVVTVDLHHPLLRADCLIDLSESLQESSFGAVTPLEQDMVMDCVCRSGVGTVSCILGGGVAVAVIEVTYQKSIQGWIASDPFLLPLLSLSLQLPQFHSTFKVAKNLNVNVNLGLSLSTGFGDIVSCTFVAGYLEPVLVLLHSDPGGRTTSGRIGRIEDNDHGAPPMYATAFSVAVANKRAALLWSCQVTGDAQFVKGFRTATECLVVGVNSLIVIQAGILLHAIAVNGWARATCPAIVQSKLQPNPIVKLAISLDGCAVTWMSTHSALLSLRSGQLYVLQQTGLESKWTVLPVGQTLTGVGEIETLIAYPFPMERLSPPTWLGDEIGYKKNIDMSFGLVIAGSRIGNSLLIGYGLESMKLQLDDDPNNFLKQPVLATSSESSYPAIDDENDRILTIEEESLYEQPPSSTSDQVPDIVPSSDAESSDEISTVTSKRQRVLRFSMIKNLHAFESLVNLGPLGPSCTGPLSSVPSFLLKATPDEENVETMKGRMSLDCMFGSPAQIFPSGFGSSGGIALVTVPGRDDRMILNEEDCLNVETIFSLPVNKVVLLSMSQKSGGGTRVMKICGTESEFRLVQVPLEDWCGISAAEIFVESTLQAGEFSDGSVLLLTRNTNKGYICFVLQNIDFKLEATGVVPIADASHGLLQVTPFVEHVQSGSTVLSFLCLWSSGEANMCSISSRSHASFSALDNGSKYQEEDIPMDTDENENDDDSVSHFYRKSRVVSVDIFKYPKRYFCKACKAVSNSQIISPESGEDILKRTVTSESCFAVDDDENDDEENLYRCSSLERHAPPMMITKEVEEFENEEGVFVAFCQQSGELNIYLFDAGVLTKCWTASGCGQGVRMLSDSSIDARRPRYHEVFAQEIRFFVCRPTSTSKVQDRYGEMFCLMIEVSNGDIELYKMCCIPGSSACFSRVPLTNVIRPSQEQKRHRIKLQRRNIVEKDLHGQPQQFRLNRLNRYHGISGQDGLFSASTIPLWIVAERGCPAILFHRTRHAAPFGGKERPVCGFCFGISIPGFTDNGFIVLHERVGRIGSQRLTIFHSLSRAFVSHGLFGGLSGLSIEKVHFGVTVRHIEFIDDKSASSGDHSLYALLVSREIDSDQSNLNSDGLTEEERQQKQMEKENLKVRKQVAADLGGFDVESEWVEEIDREDCFKVDTNLGGAPPIRKQAYSLWIVDASNKWMVVDSYELDTYEHGMTMKVMHLSVFGGDTSTVNESKNEEELPMQMIIAVGTGVCDHNGEDVACRGRVLLFQVKRPELTEVLSFSDVVADLSLVYEKEIFHGPVTTLNCLSSEGKNRLIIGAGADINIEQWENEKLTQVGFFRATMQILDIQLLKNFLLLSDAYDSLYFLVWREFDKSLTLLAKDYDPIAVYATGLVSRGSSITFLCLDDRQNLQFFQYAPGEAAARGGNKLVCRADFHLGCHTTAFSSHFCRSSLLIHSSTPTSTLAALRQQDPTSGRSEEDQKIASFFGSADGELGAIVPLNDPIYWRMLALQSVMSNALDSDCALSCQAWRFYRRTPRRGGCRSNDRKKGVIDGNLIFQFVHLPKTEQEDLASAIGSTVDLILDNMLEIQCGSMIL